MWGGIAGRCFIVDTDGNQDRIYKGRAVSRREFLIGASAIGLSLGDFSSSSATPELGYAKNRLLDLSAVEAVDAIRTGSLKAETYAEALLGRSLQLKELNAFITLDPALVLQQAREADRARAGGAPLGALHGLPVPVKDSINTLQYATTGGTPALRDFRPAADAPLVATLRAAGALVLGKTNLHELSFGWTSNNMAYGAVHNPYDVTRIPGGSSGGTAVAVAAHMAPLGVAEDTEGSIRVPAALCGVIGFRPTTRRYSTAGVVPACSLFDQTGPEARCMADIALFDRVASGDMRELGAANPKGLRLATWEGFWFEGLDPEVERITRDALKKLRAMGIEIVDAEVPGLRELLRETADLIVDHDARVELTHYLATYGTGKSLEELVAQSSPDIRAIFEHEVMPDSPGFVSEAAYGQAVNVYLPKLRKTFARYFARTGAAAIVFPSTMITAPMIGADGDLLVEGRHLSFDLAIGRNIAPGSRTGLPGLVLPAGIAANGMPVGLEFDGPAGSDRKMISLGFLIERALGSLPPPCL